MDTEQAPIAQSPCVDICRLNEQAICIGCGRSIDEIVDWSCASETQKHSILALAKNRMKTMP
jgi:predicted Fe-S protein YdhL (DUF1289 family)